MTFKPLLYLSLITLSSKLFAVTQYRREKIPFITNPSSIRTSIHIPTSDNLTKIQIPIRKLRRRIILSHTKVEVEPVNLWIKKDSKSVSDFSSLIAKKGKSITLQNEILKRITNQEPNQNGNVKIQVKETDIPLLNLKKVAQLLSKPHHEVSISSNTISTKKSVVRTLYKQSKTFLTEKQKRRLKEKLKNNKEIILGRDLLPPFAKKRLKKFLIHRGPNCFHAALSFQDEKLTKSSQVNVKQEKGYHEAMINYDELWRAINRYFYEVDVKRAKLKYGDLVVFFNIPDDKPKETNFRWIRHTATYLFDGYTFSKGSKSPNSPYSIKTLSEEWDTWNSYSKNLGVKIYRRSKIDLEKTPPADTVDWIY